MHKEALYLRPTLYSLNACASEAAENGINVELIAVFDRADEETVSVYQTTKLAGYVKVKTIKVDFGSLGLARNAGVDKAEGEYIWTADGDDLVSRNSIVQLVHAARSHGDTKAVFFVEFLVAFGEKYHVARYMNGEWLTAADFAFQHPYISRLFIHSSAFKHLRYDDLSPNTGFSYEDWDFNCKLYADGYKFITAPNTVFFYRHRSNSLLKLSNSTLSKCIPHSRIFEIDVFIRLMNESRKHNKKWNDFLKKRQLLHECPVAIEMLASKEIKDYVIDAVRLDPEVDPLLIETAPTYCPVPWDTNHWGFHLEKFYKLIGNTTDFTDVVLLPWLKPGGAEKEILLILHELHRQGAAKKILVISGQSAKKHEWLTKLPRNSVFVDLYNSFPSLGQTERNSLLVRAMLAILKENGRIHLKTSDFSHSFMESYGELLSSRYRPIYYRFCDDTINWCDARLDIGWGIKHLRKIISNLEMLISDCEFIKNKDENIFGINSIKHHVIYAQCDLINNTPHDAKPKNRLLWSSRICKQKRPDLLILILNELLKTFPDLIVDVYGDADEEYKDLFYSRDNLRYLGAYDNFAELPVDEYDAFIYTSVFDGMPNIVLEALGAGLPVIAPNVGGISEAVIDGITGFLIEDHIDDKLMVQNYLISLEKLYKNWSHWLDMSMNAKNLIAERHCAASYSEFVKKAFKLDKINE